MPWFSSSLPLMSLHPQPLSLWGRGRGGGSPVQTPGPPQASPPITNTPCLYVSSRALMTRFKTLTVNSLMLIPWPGESWLSFPLILPTLLYYSLTALSQCVATVYQLMERTVANRGDFPQLPSSCPGILCCAFSMHPCFTLQPAPPLCLGPLASHLLRHFTPGVRSSLS